VKYGGKEFWRCKVPVPEVLGELRNGFAPPFNTKCSEEGYRPRSFLRKEKSEIYSLITLTFSDCGKTYSV